MGRCLFIFIYSSLIFLLALTLPSIVLAENLVTNSDFETFDQSNFTGWSKNYSTLSLSQEIETAQVHSGSYSAKLKSTSNSSKYLYQTIASVEGTIKLSAWAKNISGDNFTSFVRISWYSTIDGTGSEITSSDSQTVSQKGEWQNISVSAKKPDSAKSLKAKLIVDPSSASEVSAIFDEVTLEHVTPLSFSLSVPEKVAIGDEFETKVDDGLKIIKIFEALNFKAVVKVEKIRKIWEFGDYEIALDRVKGLGDFVEIEYIGKDENVDPVGVQKEMISFLKGIGVGEITLNDQGYAFLLLFPNEGRYEVV